MSTGAKGIKLGDAHADVGIDADVGMGEDGRFYVALSWNEADRLTDWVRDAKTATEDVVAQDLSPVPDGVHGIEWLTR